MNSLQGRTDSPKLRNVIPIDTREGEGALDTYRAPHRPGLPALPLIYGLERWLDGFNQPEKAVPPGPSPSALWRAESTNLVEKPLPAQAGPASSHRIPPPPKLPKALQAADADDERWTPTVLNFRVGANQVVVRCRVCPYSGAVRDFG